jgi:NAD(P)-dependent dehydrogenase (short-subunit alcohol dehydrogenase family)
LPQATTQSSRRRDVGKVADLAAGNTNRVLALRLDVTDPAQVTDVMSQAEERFGGIDILVNNAGYGYRAAVEEGDDSDVRTLFETQFFGAVAMIKAALPAMRARRSGAIVNISTIGVQIMPAGSGYCCLEGCARSNVRRTAERIAATRYLSHCR